MIGTDQEINIGGENLTKDVFGALADIYRADLDNAEIEQKKLMGRKESLWRWTKKLIIRTIKNESLPRCLSFLGKQIRWFLLEG